VIKEKYDQFILWLVSIMFAWFVAIFIGLGMKARMSHNKGVAGRGKLRIVDDPEFPEHEFLSAGKEFPCRVRHASVTFNDDAMNQVRGISIKFADENFKSPFDLEANTGDISIFWTAANFLKFVWNRREKGGVQYKAYYEKEPDGFKGAQESGKHKPTSFARLDYYSKTPMNFTATDGTQYYVKYRVIPKEEPVELAAIPEEQKQRVYDQRVAENETLPVNYLVEEYKARVADKPVRYKLQLQLHKSAPDTSQEVFDSRKIWDETTHPWYDLAAIEIDEILPFKETVKMGFNLINHPKSLGFIKAKSIHDYNSIVYMRSKTKIAYRTRHLAYALFGMPKEPPVDAPRNA
jgi:arachidonate 5-lipoxygenase